MAVIYRITNMENGNYYIGSAESFARREWQHKYALRKGQHKNPRLQAAWNKYGEEMFVFEVIETVPEGSAAFEVENKYLAECVGKPDCYNINTDAIGMRTGIKMTEESKQKLSANRKGKHAGENHYRYGKVLSPEIRAKISFTQAGRPNPRKGQKMSEKGRENVKAAVKRGAESHFYGKRPANADDLQRAIVATLPDGSVREFRSLAELRDTMGVSVATTIRACKSGKPVKCGNAAGWFLSYKDEQPRAAIVIPPEHAHLPRSRQQAKAEGAKQYFTGVPCERGHVSPRSTKGTCIECRREDDAEAYRKRAQARAVSAEETREKRTVGIRQSRGLESSRQKTSEQAKAQWSDPDYAARQTENNREIASRPEVKAAKSSAAKELWANPEWREKMLAARAAKKNAKNIECARNPEQTENQPKETPCKSK